MRTASGGDIPTFPRHMEMEVPECPACGREGAAVRERVFRGDLEVTFWCCPPCGFAWRERPSHIASEMQTALG